MGVFLHQGLWRLPAFTDAGSGRGPEETCDLCCRGTGFARAWPWPGRCGRGRGSGPAELTTPERCRPRVAPRRGGVGGQEVSSGAAELTPAPRPVFALRAEKGAERLQRPSRACRTQRGRAMSDQVPAPPALAGRPFRGDLLPGVGRLHGGRRRQAAGAREELSAGPDLLPRGSPGPIPRSVRGATAAREAL